MSSAFDFGIGFLDFFTLNSDKRRGRAEAVGSSSNVSPKTLTRY